jgi:NAD(P) transhydrogenase subunit alpha
MAATDELLEQGVGLANQAKDLSNSIAEYALQASAVAEQADGGHGSFLIMALSIFVLACFVGYYVVWRVTPALHSPLMAVTNAISSVIIVGALLAAGAEQAFTFSSLMGFIAVLLASINIFGGFIVTRRMLGMFKKNGANKK